MPLAGDLDPRNLADAGWGVIFGQDIAPEVKEAIAPLLRRRKEQAGRYYREFTYTRGLTKHDFLASHKAPPGAADPSRVPYHLLIVGSPEVIPFRFQTDLDIQYSVGRIFFDTVQDYASYAHSVVNAETGEVKLPPRTIAFFGPEHPNDIASTIVSGTLITPLTEYMKQFARWQVRAFRGEDATKDRLRRLLEGSDKPAILFSAAHGVAFSAENPKHLKAQGAVLCQDWPGPNVWKGELSEDHYFSAADLPFTADLSGSIAFLFGCFSAGTSPGDDVPSLHEIPIISKPFLSLLAQRMLASPKGGCLAVIGHVGRAWTTSFSWSAEGQTDLFEGTLRRLITGHSVGSAMEYLNSRAAELLADLSRLWEDRDNLVSVSRTDFERLRRAAADLRDFVVLGDPAVRVSVDPFAGAVGDLCGATSDRIAERDQLGFIHYIEAFADLVESSHTQLPLTVGILGSWGMGKSFLLKHIEREIANRQSRRTPRKPWRHRLLSILEQERISWAKFFRRLFRWSNALVPKRPAVSRIYVVTYNAWEYSACDAIWPGLVRKIMNCLERKIVWPWPGRFLVKLARNVKDVFRKEQGRILVVSYVAAATAAAVLFSQNSGKHFLKEVLAALLAAGVLGGFFKLVADTLANPIGQWVTDIFHGGDYGRQIERFAKIRRDLEFLERELRDDGGRVLILIDDLDRCEPEKVVEMLQAVNLLLDFDTFIVFLGIDARIITRAVERHYQGLLGEAGASGYEYLDKIVQIPFRIPTPEATELESFLADLMDNPVPTALDELREAVAVSPAAFGDSPSTSIASQMTGQGTATAASTEGSFPNELEEKEDTRGFSYQELQAFKKLIPFLEPNPRHLKRLVNVYRLVRTLAARTEPALLRKPGATICWVVLCAQWPYTASRMLRRFEELERKREQEGTGFPSGFPLSHLLSDVTQRLKSGQRRTLDQKTEHLTRLVNQAEDARMGWEDLKLIRRFTVNFNPATEFDELIDDEPLRKTAKRGK